MNATDEGESDEPVGGATATARSQETANPRSLDSLHRPPLMTPVRTITADQLERLVEAMLFINSAPVEPDKLASCYAGVTTGFVEQIIERLRARYRLENRPGLILQTADGYQLRIRPDLAISLTKPGKAKLSREGLEILSVIAYRQPIARRAIEDFWGKDPAGPLRNLLRRGLVRIASGSGRNAVYQTTERFLSLMQINSLKDLPRIADDPRL